MRIILSLIIIAGIIFACKIAYQKVIEEALKEARQEYQRNYPIELYDCIQECKKNYERKYYGWIK